MGVDAEFTHCVDDCLSRLEKVLVDCLSIDHEFVSGITIFMDDLHLLYDCGLSRLARAYIDRKENVRRGGGGKKR